MDESEKVKVTYNLKRRKYLISSMQAFTSKNKYNAYRISVSRDQFHAYNILKLVPLLVV